MKNWQPLADQILVRALIPADRTATGLLILPENNRERPQQGIVVAVGPGAFVEGVGLVTPQVDAGDLVAFGKYAGIDFELDGEPVLLMRDREALARKVAGTYELVEHEIAYGVGTRRVAHEAGRLCEHCQPVKSTFLEEERERLIIGDATGVR